MSWHKDPTRYMFFTGKGGVGKTSLACATAVHLAKRGMRVLLVSTDPASNLSHVFDVRVDGHDPTLIIDAPNLHVLNIDPEAAAQAYRERIVGPVRGVLPERTVHRMEEELSGACTTEIASFDEFTALLTDEAATAPFAHIIFDTAPTGHTLRLLSLPLAWSSFLDANQSGASCLGPLAGLEKQRKQYAAAVGALCDRGRSTVILVSRPQLAALEEAARTSAELTALGLTNQRLVLNGLMPETSSCDPLAAAMRRRDRDALARMPQALRQLPVDSVSLRPIDMVGVEALHTLLSDGLQSPEPAVVAEPFAMPVGAASLGQLVDDIAAEGHGLVLVMGKGGVGKTTIAAAVAVELAARAHAVHLTTTDPAAHVADVVGPGVDHLEITRIDPRVETERYRRHVLETRGKGLDAQGRSLLEEDLRSPCTEEIAVFQAFSQVIAQAGRKFVVVDTAPTGHTLLLLDATGAYHREIKRHAREGMEVMTPLMRLQDSSQTRILIVTLPETTPVLEAAALQKDLRRAGIEPWAWVINASLAAARPHDPLLIVRACAELPHLHRVQVELASRVAIVPWLMDELADPEGLRNLTRCQANAGEARMRDQATCAGSI